MFTRCIPQSLGNGSDEEQQFSPVVDESRTSLARDLGGDVVEKAGANKESGTRLVGFNGPKDTSNPRNWSGRRKWVNIAVISMISTVTPLAAAILAPSIPQFLNEFDAPDSLMLGAFAVSIYTLGFAIGPLLLSPLSELYGRLTIYHSCGILYIVFTVACGLATNLNMLIGFRFLAGCAGSAPLTIGGGSIADMMVPEKRGAAMSIQAFGGMMGPAIGPVAGAFLSQSAGWRWVLWLVAILSGVTTMSGIVVMRETCASIILERQAHRLRKSTKNQAFRSELANDLDPPSAVIQAISRPAKMLMLSPMVFLFSLLMGLAYGLMYLLYTTISEVYEHQYNFSIGLSGVAYLGAGIGTFIGLGIIMYYSDKIAVRKAGGGEIKPEHRLPPLIYGYLPFPAGFLIFGWTTQFHVHWIVPILANGLTGIGVMFVYLPVQIYLVDCYPVYAASSLAAVSFFRSVLGAVLPLAGNGLDNNLGLGVGNTVLAAIAIAFWPVGIIAYVWGERLRQKFPLRL